MQAETRTQTSLRETSALDPALPRLTSLDIAFLALLGLMIAGHIAAALLASGWITAALIDVLALVYFVALLARPAWRPLVGRLLLLGLVAGIFELFTDAAGHQFARSLFYPQDQPLFWDSPFYMPLSWMIVLTQLG